jgi:TrpR-related protein YerC/YecD
MKQVSDKQKVDRLYAAMLTMRTPEECVRFFRDLLTATEIEEFANRFAAAELLDAGTPYREVAERVGMSTATVSRIASWLRGEAGGYRLAIERLHAPITRRISERRRPAS